ncbi:hypothetical protein SDC9_99743 [bioreactor metagenome]|uniref:Uncharacterized protein n=1 Tax=bioreactor metagenome TaxID=1076179 RepID=A0A645AII3_9ZZZZ
MRAGCAARPERGDHVGAGGIAFGPVGRDVFARQSAVERIGVISTPVVLRGGQSGGRSDGQHVDVVANAVHRRTRIQSGLDGGRSTGGVSVLADDAAALGNQGVRSFRFSGRIIPRVGIGHVHVRIGNDALDAKIEAGEAADHFGIRISADITDIRIGHNACIQHFLELHAGNDAGDIAALKRVGERVLEVGQSAQGSAVTSHGDEGHVRIFGSGLLHVGLMAVAVGEDVGAALLNEVDCGIVAGFIFANVVLPDDAGVRNTNVRGSGLDAFDVRGVIARVIVVNEDYADFEGGFFGGRFGGGFFGRFYGLGRCGHFSRRFGGGLAGCQREHHHDDCQQSNDLFHGFPPAYF